MNDEVEKMDWNSNFVNSIDGKYDFSLIPDKGHGVYVMVGIDSKIVYVGKTEEQTFRKRVSQHYGTQEENELLISQIQNNSPMEVYFAETDKRIAANIEQYLIETLKPLCNDRNAAERSIKCELPDIY